MKVEMSTGNLNFWTKPVVEGDSRNFTLRKNGKNHIGIAVKFRSRLSSYDPSNE